MNFKSLLIFIFISIILLEVPDNNYLWPTNTSKTITTLFGEKRSRRFHAGIDVRTFGRIGDELFAIESGYISRIKVTSDGYGKAIYLKLNDGNTALYAHLDKFNDNMESVFKNLQINNDNSFLDISFSKNKYKVNKGDLIGYCGDSGSISGPHLHFELWKKNGEPINPLKKYYEISDTLKPIAESIAFIPLDKNCFINGDQNYEVLDLKPLKYNGDSNFYKYFLEDTISVIGNFGVAINTYDKINFSPFDFGVYEIQLIIDNKEMYKINFDKYKFNHDPLIYRTIDYNLLTNQSKTFYRLFINHNSNLDFISNESIKGINLDKGFHNLIINIVDNYENKIQVQAILKGDILPKPISEFDIKKHSITFDKPQDNITFSLSTRIENSLKVPLKYSIYDSTIYQFDSPEKPYEVLEYSIFKNGIKSNPSYISLLEFDPYKISGKFEIIHYDNNIEINFIEDLFSGYDAKLILSYNKSNGNYKNPKEINLSRFNKNILTTGLLEINDLSHIKDIKIKYQTYPEIVFTKQINGKAIKSNKENYYSFNNLSIKTNKESLYSDIFISVENSTIKVPEIFEEIYSPFIIKPNNIPFKNYINLSYLDDSNGAIFSYNHNSEKWFYNQDNKNDSLTVSINSGQTFAILDEKKSPIIKNIFPSNESTYDLSDLKMISFNAIDNQSGINSKSIEIYLNNQKQYYEYIKYRNLIRASINENHLSKKNNLKIIVKDNLENSKKYNGSFYIK